MTNKLLIASLFHDIGKVILRSGKTGEHSCLGAKFLKELDINFSDEVINAIAYHHKRLHNDKEFKDSDIVYIVQLADKITANYINKNSIVEITETHNLLKITTPLKSVYSLINFKTEDKFYLTNGFINNLVFPSEKKEISKDYYKNLVNQLENNLLALGKFSDDKNYINRLIDIFKLLFYYVPFTTSPTEMNDISLFSHSKMTACIAHSIYDYLKAKNRSNYKEELVDNEKSFLDEKAFLMASVDVSGIQNFIYTITTDSAQKQLRARSIYLELVMENFIDEILTQTGYSRANLLYSGGGHCYILMANTEENIRIFNDVIERQNDWFIENFGIALYVAGATKDCSARELFPSTKEDVDKYKAIFNSLSKELSIKKTQRYTLKQIQRLNNRSNGKRECRVCGINTASADICSVCNSLIRFGSQFVKKDNIFTLYSASKEIDNELKFFSYQNGTNYLQFINKNEIKKTPSNSIRIYVKNSFETSENETAIFMGDYAVEDFTFDDYAEISDGIKRLGVLRADVDNLGKAFVNGFDVNYTTLSRISTFSESLSLFFKYYINTILENKGKKYRSISLLPKIKEEKRNISVVYSGGDDLFIVGAWNEVLEFAVDLNNYFSKFCLNKLTLSAGFGLFEKSYPISAMAKQTGQLELWAKSKGKNRIALFDKEDGFVFTWDELKRVIDKLHFLEEYYSQRTTDTNSCQTEIFKLMKLTKQIENDPINLARLAYALSRINDKLNKVNEDDRVFINTVYDWAKNERNQLLAALTLLLYLNRDKVGDKDEEF